MSSRRVEVSSGDEFSDHASPLYHTSNLGKLLHPTWNNLNSQPKFSKAKSTCGKETKKGSEVDQILYYKEKAHQSFMQVMQPSHFIENSQVQQLHDEEIQQLKQEYENKIKSLQNDLTQKKQQFRSYHCRLISILQKNSKQHMLDMQQTLEIDGLDLIQCKQNQFNKFDESSILNFNQIMGIKQGDLKIQSMQENILKFISTQVIKNILKPDVLMENIKRELHSIFQHLKEVRFELMSKIDSHSSLLKKYEETDLTLRKLKVNFDALQKDALLMSQNLKKAISQKKTLQQKLTQIEKQLRVKQNTKQALLKIAVNDNTLNTMTSSSKNLLVKSAQNKVKVFKSHREVQDKSKIPQETDEFLKNITKKVQIKSQRDDDSFDMKDLLEQMEQSKEYSQSILQQKRQKKAQLFVTSSLNSKVNSLRKKSNDN